MRHHLLYKDMESEAARPGLSSTCILCCLLSSMKIYFPRLWGGWWSGGQWV